MRCVVITSPGANSDNLVLQDRDDLVASGENVRISVRATALNRADLLQMRGLYPPPPKVPPDVPGLEFIGVIDQVGDAVTEWEGGERVFGLVGGGAFSEQLITHERTVVAVPDELDDVEAAAVPEAFITAHDALVTQGGLKAGDLVFIHAVASGVGSAAVQIVHRWGARSIGSAGSRAKLEKIEAIAPFFPINYKEEDFKKKTEEVFGEMPLDLILDLVGGPRWPDNLSLLKKKGALVLVGLMGGAAAEAPLATVLRNRLRITGTVLRSRPLEEKIEATRAFAHQVVPCFKNGQLRPVVDSVFPFEEITSAIARMENSENVGKIVLTLA